MVYSYSSGVSLCLRVRLYITGRLLHFCGTYLYVIGYISVLWGKSGLLRDKLVHFKFILGIMRCFCSVRV